MPNKRGKSWDFPDYTTPEQMQALYQARIDMLELRKQQLEARVEELEEALDNASIPVPDEILEAHVVTDLDSD